MQSRIVPRIEQCLRSLQKWTSLEPGSRLRGESGHTYLIGGDCWMLPEHMHFAKQVDNDQLSFYVKQPRQPNSQDFYGTSTIEKSRVYELNRFRNEARMNEVFKGVKFIWQQVDTILPTAKMQPPRLVYEHVGETVYEARALRPFTRREIKSIMKSTLLALQEIERRGFVHPELNLVCLLLPTEKLDSSKPAEFFAKIANTEAFLKPSSVHRRALRLPNTYDAPEMLFGKPLSFPAHIWSWAVILCHLLEGRASWISGKPESIAIGGMLQTWHDPHRWFEGVDNILLVEVVRDFNIKQCDYYWDCRIPKVPEFMVDENGWKEHLRKKGMWDDDVCFLDWLLDPNPETRPTSKQILDTGFLEWNEEDVEDESQTFILTEGAKAHTQ